MPKKHVQITQKFCDNLPDGLREDVLKLMDELPDEQRVIKRVCTLDASPLISAPVVTTDEDSDKREAMLYASTRTLDRDAEIVIPDGIQLDQYRKNPVLLFGHQWGNPPIGSMKNIYSDGFGLRGTAMFAGTDRAEEIWQLVKGGHIRTSSIGFIPTEVITRDRHPKEFAQMVTYAQNSWGEFGDDEAASVRAFITKSIMLENSIVPIPANPEALIQSVHGKSLTISDNTLKLLGIGSDDKLIDIEVDSKANDDLNEGKSLADVDPEPEAPKVKTIMRVIRKGPAKVTQPTQSEVEDMAKQAVEIMRGKI